MPYDRFMRPFGLLAAALLCSLAGCRTQPKLKSIILSYSEENANCIGCPKFQVEFREGGDVTFTCLNSCAVPGEQHHLVPEQRFRDLVAAFHYAGFFKIPRTDPSRIVFDAIVIRLTYRDAERIHEVVDINRDIPRIKDLESRIKAATDVERYLKPSVAVYRRLLDSGWDVNTAGPDHQNALFTATALRDLASIRLLLKRGSGVTDLTLEFAAMSDDVTILRELLAASQVRLTGSISAIMLVQAARSRKPDCLQVLLDSGFDVNSRDSGQGWTPLLSAVASDSFENVRMLLSRGADANARDPNGRTPLWYAATTANTGTITLLTQHGADVNTQDNQGRTPLMHASDLCYTWNIHAFLNAGGDPTVTDKRGRTALQSEFNTVGYPKCNEARQILREASNSWPTRPRQYPARATFPKRRE